MTDFQNVYTKMFVWAYIMTKKKKQKKMVQNPPKTPQNPLKTLNFEFLVNFDPFILYQKKNFFLKIAFALTIILV